MSADVDPPDRFIGDRYHVVRELGRGGMGVVYLGRDLRLDMDVAIKFRGVTHGDATLWLKREFRAVASLRHPNLVELYELVAHEKSCYFTMEYLPGVDPRRWVEKRAYDEAVVEAMTAGQTTRSALPLQEARTAISAADFAAQLAVQPRPVPQVDMNRVRTLLAQLAEGLAFLHASGVIHRDVKPSNAIVVDGQVKLLDFGLALERSRQAEDLARETRVVGTAAYLAPEYLDHLEVSPQMDVYALGVLGFELVTGAPPFGGTLHVLGRLHKQRAIPRASTINAEVPHDVDDLIARMLAHDPAERPTALAVATILTGHLSTPRPLRLPPRFVGREPELARLSACVADPQPRARLAMVTGPSGVGKTALVDEAVHRAKVEHGAADDAIVWRGRCHERERVPYRAFDLIIDDLAMELAGDPRLAREIEHVAALCRVFPVLAPLVDAVLDEDADRFATPAADLRVERERALAAMVQLFAHLLRVSRGIVVIDDLQWADADSLELLALLVERVARPLTVIASWTTSPALDARVDTAPPPWPGDGAVEATAPPVHVLPAAATAMLERLGARAQRIDLSVMEEADLARIIRNLAPDLPRGRIAGAAQQAAGSPYLAELIGSELGRVEGGDLEAP
ncbi:MAG: serine/threonine-protein kinase PknK, partial [Deltaproteobacteria bacterium]|nr:serine/threonine-protein kinase PknK [Deltaproteobacteria bacterium]